MGNSEARGGALDVFRGVLPVRSGPQAQLMVSCSHSVSRSPFPALSILLLFLASYSEVDHFAVDAGCSRKALQYADLPVSFVFHLKRARLTSFRRLLVENTPDLAFPTCTIMGAVQ